VVSAAWEPGFGTSWHGWWVLNDGAARPGAPVTAVCRSADKLDLFLTGDDGTVWTAWWQTSSPGWHGWTTLLAGRRFLPGAPVGVVSRSADKLDLFATDIDGNVMTAAWEPAFADGWRGWWALADGHAAPGAPVSRGPDMLDVFVVDAEGRPVTSGWGPGRGPAWTPWHPLAL
jgi:hypothetical protein